jgi:hypothetical protein
VAVFRGYNMFLDFPPSTHGISPIPSCPLFIIAVSTVPLQFADESNKVL